MKWDTSDAAVVCKEINIYSFILDVSVVWRELLISYGVQMHYVV